MPITSLFGKKQPATVESTDSYEKRREQQLMQEQQEINKKYTIQPPAEQYRRAPSGRNPDYPVIEPGQIPRIEIGVDRAINPDKYEK